MLTIFYYRCLVVEYDFIYFNRAYTFNQFLENIRPMYIFLFMPFLLMIWNKAILIINCDEHVNLTSLMYLKCDGNDSGLIKNSFKYYFYFYLNLFFVMGITTFSTFFYKEYPIEIVTLY
jgi:hypothetical protein